MGKAEEISVIQQKLQVINDVREPVRCLAAQLIGRMNKVSQTFLEQTLDKKLMSNMRVKKSSHERQEWSSVFKCYFFSTGTYLFV